MNSDARLTVVMSCYNQADTIRQAIDSVLAQKTDFRVNLLITDDHSTADASREIVREYAERYPDRVTALLNDENGRYLKNILRAMELVKTEYFTLLDADDYWTDPSYLQDAVDFLSAHRDFTIYFRNVTCLQGDAERSYVPDEFPSRDFTFDDYLSNEYVMSQTTGEVFRNVVYGDGVPKRMYEVIGTIHERAFEGDVARFIMHLAKGKAHFENRSAGVYRILPSGIWCRLHAFEKHLLQAQGPQDFHSYLGRGLGFFVNSAYGELQAAMSALPDFLKGGGVLDEKYLPVLSSVVTWVSANRECIVDVPPKSRAVWLAETCGWKLNGRAKPSGLDKLRYKIWKHLNKRLVRAGVLKG